MAGLEMEWNPAFFEEVLKSAPVRQAVENVADKAVSRAQSIAPVRTGKYRANIKKEVREGEKRVYAYVYSDVDYSIPVESYHGTMTRTAGSL